MKLPAGSVAELKGMTLTEGFPYYQKAFSAQVELFKKLAKSSWVDALPSEKEEQEKKIAGFKKLEKLLEKEVKALSKENFENPSAALDRRIGVATIFMYLFDKTIELHTAVLEKDKDGLYALFDTTRDSIHSLLEKDYFSRPHVEVVHDYIQFEPCLVACAELAEVELVAVQKAVALYHPKLADMVGELMESGETKK